MFFKLDYMEMLSNAAEKWLPLYSSTKIKKNIFWLSEINVFLS